MFYYVITTSEDGDVSISVMDKETLQARLKEKYWGRVPIRRLDKNVLFFDLRNEAGVIIIRGESILPKPVQVVTEWEI